MEPNIINEIMQHINNKMNEFKTEVIDLIAQATKPSPLQTDKTTPTSVPTPTSSPNFGFKKKVEYQSNFWK
jgi:hypothetical protein